MLDQGGDSGKAHVSQPGVAGIGFVMSASSSLHISVRSSIIRSTVPGLAVLGTRAASRDLRSAWLPSVFSRRLGSEQALDPLGGLGPVRIRLDQFIAVVCPRQVSHRRPVGQVRGLVKGPEMVPAVCLRLAVHSSWARSFQPRALHWRAMASPAFISKVDCPHQRRSMPLTSSGFGSTTSNVVCPIKADFLGSDEQQGRLVLGPRLEQETKEVGRRHQLVVDDAPPPESNRTSLASLGGSGRP